MTDTLSNQEIKELLELAKKIKLNLECDFSFGLPCRTCRLDAVELMKKYVSIHND